MKRTVLFGALVLCAACGGSSGAKAPVTAPTKETTTAPPPTKAGYTCPAPPAVPFHIVTQEGIPTMAELQPSRDGRILGARGSAREVQLWNIASGNKVGVIAWKTPIVKWSLRPDGHGLASVADGKLWLKDFDRGGLDKSGLGAAVALPGGDVERMDWSTDGKTLFVVRGGQTDLVDGKAGTVTASIAAVATSGGVSGDGRWLVARDGAVWDVKANKSKWKIPAIPSSAAFSDNGDTLAVATGDKAISVLDAATGAKRFELSTTGRREGEISISPDGKSVSAYDSGEYKYPRNEQVDTGIALWFKGKRVRIAKASESAPTRASFSPDGKSIAYVRGSRYGQWGYEIVVADAATGARPKNTALTDQVKLEPPRWSADGRTVMQPGVYGLLVFDLGAKGERRTVGKVQPAPAPSGASYVHDAVWSPDDGSLLVVADQNDSRGFRSAASIVDLKTGTVGRSIDAKNGSQNAYVRRFRTGEWSGEGGFISLVRSDGIVLWDGKAPNSMRVLDAGETDTEERLMSVTTKGNMVATTSASQKEVRLWDPKTGAKLRAIALEESNVEAISFSADGTRLAIATLLASTTGEQSAQILIYDPANGTLVRTLHAQARQVYFARGSALHWAPQGKAIVSVDSQGGVDLWNTANDDAPQALFDRTTPGASAVAEGGNYIFAGNPVLGLWDLRTRSLARELPGDGSSIEHIRISRSGGTAAVSRGDHVDLYRLSDGAHLKMTFGSAGILMNADNGAYAGPKDGLAALRVRDGDLEVRPLRPNEITSLTRPTLAMDFVAGCALEPAQ